MSECGLWRTAKRTLCGIILGAGITVGIVSCMRASERVPEQQAEQSVDEVVRDALKYFAENDTAKAQGLLEQHRNYLAANNKGILSPTSQCLLALAYAANWNNSAETEFRSLIYRFEQSPQILDPVQRDLREFFGTEPYKKIEKLVNAYTGMLPKLNAVIFFLKLAQEDYEGARDYCKKALPHFTEKKKDYQLIFATLIGEASRKNDYKRVFGYSQVMEAFAEMKSE